MMFKNFLQMFARAKVVIMKGCVCVCVRVRVCVCVCVCVSYTCKYLEACVCLSMCLRVYVRVRARVYICVHACECVCVCVYACVCSMCRTSEITRAYLYRYRCGQMSCGNDPLFFLSGSPKIWAPVEFKHLALWFVIHVRIISQERNKLQNKSSYHKSCLFVF